MSNLSYFSLSEHFNNNFMLNFRTSKLKMFTILLNLILFFMEFFILEIINQKIHHPPPLPSSFAGIEWLWC